MSDKKQHKKQIKPEEFAEVQKIYAEFFRILSADFEKTKKRAILEV